MITPEFFARIPPLVLADPLAEMLGATEGGVVEYRYVDAVRLAGHSCPTVAGAWLMTARALQALYPDAMPQRGGIRVALREAQTTGTTGVVAAVIGLITGAAGEGGFQGLGGRFGRRGLLTFGVEMRGGARFTRLDSDASVELAYHPQAVPPEAAMQELMPRVVSGGADASERAEFARLWQARVERILLPSNDAPGLLEAIA